MEKLLHERLREYGESGTRIGHSSPLVQALEHYQLTPRLDSVYGESCFFRKLADEIERCYAPLPRYEGGTPISKGCEAEGGIVSGWCIWDDGAFSLNNDEGEVIQEGDPGEFVKRPTPKVLDADGVPYKNGDTVYDIEACQQGNTYWGKPLTVVGFSETHVTVYQDGHGTNMTKPTDCFTHERPVFDANGERICKGDACWYTDRLLTKRFRGDKVTVKGIYENGITVYNETRGFSQYELSPESLTHREPDSLEKLQDLISAIDNVHGGSNTELHLQLDKAYDMCTALIEKGA